MGLSDFPGQRLLHKSWVSTGLLHFPVYPPSIIPMHATWENIQGLWWDNSHILDLWEPFWSFPATVYNNQKFTAFCFRTSAYQHAESLFSIAHQSQSGIGSLLALESVCNREYKFPAPIIPSLVCFRETRRKFPCSAFKCFEANAQLVGYWLNFQNLS